MYRVIWRARPAFVHAMAVMEGGVAGLTPLAALLEGIPTVGPPEPLLGAAFPLELPGMAVKADDMAAYTHVFVRNRGLAIEVASRLHRIPGAEAVEIQPRPSEALRWTRGGRPVPFTPFAPTPDLTGEQGYLSAAPAGIGLGAAIGVPGAGGDGVRVVDIEYGWNFHHEDLRQLSGGVIHGVREDSDHGTAVLGIFSGDENGVGVRGIAPRATAYAASATYDGANGRWNMAAAILAVAKRLRPGDVILLEMHGPGPNTDDPATQRGFVPVEYWTSDRDAIARVTAMGIHVVEAAGNGAEDLDAPLYEGRFDRDQFDSGAILVGAGASGATGEPSRARCDFSNYGSRVDVQGWGDSIVTTGGASEEFYRDRVWAKDPNRCYTRSFGGTSGATPIVAGCVASIEGARRERGLGPLSPRAMRDLLVRTGSPQDPSVNGAIGPLPDLARALPEALHG